jgi:hypothetical protein
VFDALARECGLALGLSDGFALVRDFVAKTGDR